MLGNAIAHEVGHVLLGCLQHSSAGLMKAPWDKTDYLRSQAGMMQFTAAEGQIIRKNARPRIDRVFTAEH